MTDEEKLKEQQMFKDLWAFRKSFYNPTNDDSYWEKCLETLKKSSERHKSKFFDSLLLACFADLEVRFKDGPGDWSEERIDYVVKLLRSM